MKKEELRKGRVTIKRSPASQERWKPDTLESSENHPGAVG